MALSLRAWGVTNATRDGSNCQLSGWKWLIAIDWDDLRSLGRARPGVHGVGRRNALGSILCDHPDRASCRNRALAASGRRLPCAEIYIALAACHAGDADIG